MFKLLVSVFHKTLLKLYHTYPFLENNFIWRSIQLRYLFYAYNDSSSLTLYDTDGYFEANADRVKAIASILADKRSKEIYLGMIKYRQTRSKRDFPFHRVREAQYFLKELALGKDEVFIDCGASGWTIDFFIRHCPHYQQIIAFEPDTKNFQTLYQRHSSNPKITLLKAGVFEDDRLLSFAKSDNAASGHTLFGDKASLVSTLDSDESDNKIEVKSIDNLGLPKVTFIKMDIEGAEMSALRGARQTILRDKPKLAISIYHSCEDMIQIAEYIHTLVPEYKLYVRHYGGIYDTILYAVLG